MAANIADHALAVREMTVSGLGLNGLTVKGGVTGVEAAVGAGTPSNT
jgi:hypothetical protein